MLVEFFFFFAGLWTLYLEKHENKSNILANKDGASFFLIWRVSAVHSLQTRTRKVIIYLRSLRRIWQRLPDVVFQTWM